MYIISNHLLSIIENQSAPTIRSFFILLYETNQTVQVDSSPELFCFVYFVHPLIFQIVSVR